MLVHAGLHDVTDRWRSVYENAGSQWYETDADHDVFAPGRRNRPRAGPHDDAGNPRAGPRAVDATSAAEDIQRRRPGWLVLYGVYSREFVAFPLFAVRRRVIVTAKYPEALTERMDAAEQRWRIWPGQSEGNES